MSGDQFKNMEEAIRQGIQDYEELPLAYNSRESAIKYRVAQFIWSRIRAVDTAEAGEILWAIKQIND